jgi:hypothetical protein
MYRGMQKYYHTGLVLGLVSVGALAFAFRCWCILYHVKLLFLLLFITRFTLFIIIYYYLLFYPFIIIIIFPFYYFIQ